MNIEHVSYYPRQNSPYYWVSYFSSKKGKRVHESSKIKIDHPEGKRNIIALAHRLSGDAAVNKPAMEKSAWALWVIPFLKEKYSDPLTLRRNLGGWKVLREWLHEKEIQTPAQVQYKHAREWVAWRKEQKKRNGKLISHNTALADLRTLSVVLKEAVNRGYCPAVTIAGARIKKAAGKVKPEILPDELAAIRKGLRTKPQWMQDSFAIAIAQGCRLREVQVPMHLVDEKRRVITFRIKGGRMHSTRLMPDLLPLVARRRKEKAAYLVELPDLPSQWWRRFFDSVDLPNVVFHCTRVTVITTLARSGVSEQQAMRFVGQSSALVHAIYQRLCPPDLSLAEAALSSLSSSGTSGRKGSPRSKPQISPAS